MLSWKRGNYLGSKLSENAFFIFPSIRKMCKRASAIGFFNKDHCREDCRSPCATALSWVVAQRWVGCQLFTFSIITLYSATSVACRHRQSRGRLLLTLTLFLYQSKAGKKIEFGKTWLKIDTERTCSWERSQILIATCIQRVVLNALINLNYMYAIGMYLHVFTIYIQCMLASLIGAYFILVIQCIVF